MNLLAILDELLVCIFANCSIRDVVDVSRVCKRFQTVTNTYLVGNAVCGLPTHLDFPLKEIARDVYHAYYLYSLTYLTKDTPLDKRNFALLARKSIKAGLLSLTDLEYFEKKLRPKIEAELKVWEGREIMTISCGTDGVHEIKYRPMSGQFTETGQVFVEMHMRLTGEVEGVETTGKIYRSSKSYTYQAKKLGFRLPKYVDIVVEAADKNKHKVFEDIIKARLYPFPYGLTPRSDGFTTAMAFTQMKDPFLYLGEILDLLKEFIQVDNAGSFAVIVKYLRPRLNRLQFLGLLGQISYNIAYKDAVNCYFAFKELCDHEHHVVVLESLAYVNGSLGIAGYSDTQLDTFKKLFFNLQNILLKTLDKFLSVAN